MKTSLLRLLLASSARLLGMWRILVILYLFNLALISLPSLLLFSEITDSLGNSRTAETLRTSYDEDWFEEYQGEARGTARTLEPTLSGEGGLLASLDHFISGRIFALSPALTWLGAAYVFFWIFSSGGVLAVTGGRTLSPGFADFVHGGGLYFGRFLRIGLIALTAYAAAFVVVRIGAGSWVMELLRDSNDERVDFAFVVSGTLLLLAVWIVINLLTDYTRIATVQEGRQSILLAFFRGLSFVRENPRAVFGLYLLLGLLLLAAIAFLAALAPDAGTSSWLGVAAALLLGQIMVLARISVRVLFLTSQCDLYQSIRQAAVQSPAETPLQEPLPDRRQGLGVELSSPLDP